MLDLPLNLTGLRYWESDILNSYWIATVCDRGDHVLIIDYDLVDEKSNTCPVKRNRNRIFCAWTWCFVTLLPVRRASDPAYPSSVSHNRTTPQICRHRWTYGLPINRTWSGVRRSRLRSPKELDQDGHFLSVRKVGSRFEWLMTKTRGSFTIKWSGLRRKVFKSTSDFSEVV